ncbi:MAG: phosphoribosyltransferase family protein [Pseudomonadota bacterium]
MEKTFVDEEELMLDAYRLGVLIFNSGFRPDFIVGLWRGGSSVGIVVQECLQYLGVESDHISLRTSYRGVETYEKLIEKRDNIRVHGTQYLLENMNADDSLLIVDDVFSTGLNVEAVINRLKMKMRRNLPHDIRVAVPWYKPGNNKTGRAPDYYLHETQQWLVLPYELTGMPQEELAERKPAVAEIVAELRSQ